ncbi:MAG: hypothetical protein WCF85_13975 [Rhodospirillaceae bacterium]
MSVIQRAMEQIPYPPREGVLLEPWTRCGAGTPRQPDCAGEPAAEAIIPTAAAAPASSLPVPDASRRFSLDFSVLEQHGLITPTSRQSRLAEEIRLVKRRLLHRMQPGAGDREETDHGSRTVLITSSRPGEGKSFLALNLALSLILDEGLNVLLVDASVARPTMLKRLGLTAMTKDKPLLGLTDLLRDPNLPVSATLLRDPERRLSILPPGTPVDSATDLFTGARMRALVADFGHRYPDRVLLFDAPPLLARTEPIALARLVGQILFVVECNKTPFQVIASALELIHNNNCISMVMNKMNKAGSHNRFGDYHAEYSDN